MKSPHPSGGGLFVFWHLQKIQVNAALRLNLLANFRLNGFNRTS